MPSRSVTISALCPVREGSVALQDCFVMVREHLLAVAVHIGAEKILGASHHDRIGAVQPGTAAAGRGEEVVVVSAFVDVCGLESRAGRPAEWSRCPA